MEMAVAKPGGAEKEVEVKAQEKKVAAETVAVMTGVAEKVAVGTVVVVKEEEEPAKAAAAKVVVAKVAAEMVEGLMAVAVKAAEVMVAVVMEKEETEGVEMVEEDLGVAAVVARVGAGKGVAEKAEEAEEAMEVAVTAQEAKVAEDLEEEKSVLVAKVVAD